MNAQRIGLIASTLMLAVIVGVLAVQVAWPIVHPGIQAGAPAESALEQVRGIRTHAKTPAADIDQRGAGPVAIFRVARTPVAVLENNGNLTLSKFGAIVQTVTPTRTSTPTSTNTPTNTPTATP